MEPTDALFWARKRPRLPLSARARLIREAGEDACGPRRAITVARGGLLKGIVQALAAAGRSTNGRTSIVPRRAEGMRAAIAVASSRSFASIR